MHYHTYKYLSLSFQNTLCNVGETREDPDCPVLWNKDDYHITFYRLTTCDTLPLVYFPFLWNQFHYPISSTSNKSIFEKEPWLYFMEKLSAINGMVCYVFAVILMIQLVQSAHSAPRAGLCWSHVMALYSINFIP
jgi:hypothetical protein